MKDSIELQRDLEEAFGGGAHTEFRILRALAEDPKKLPDAVFSGTNGKVIDPDGIVCKIPKLIYRALCYLAAESVLDSCDFRALSTELHGRELLFQVIKLRTPKADSPDDLLLVRQGISVIDQVKPVDLDRYRSGA